MKSLLVQLDEPTLEALNRAAPKRQRAEFVRAAIRKAIRELEEEQIRLAYVMQPDTDTLADDWSDLEPWDAAALEQKRRHRKKAG